MSKMRLLLILDDFHANQHNFYHFNTNKNKFYQNSEDNQSEINRINLVGWLLGEGGKINKLIKRNNDKFQISYNIKKKTLKRTSKNLPNITWWAQACLKARRNISPCTLVLVLFLCPHKLCIWILGALSFHKVIWEGWNLWKVAN